MKRSYSDRELDKLIQLTSFNSLKLNFNKDYYKSYVAMNYFKEDMEFFRKGVAGNWHTYFDKEMSDTFDRVINEKLKVKIALDYGDTS